MQKVQMTLGSGSATPEVNKPLQTLQARAEICGCLLHSSANRRYTVRCSPSEPCIRAVGNMLRGIGGAQ
jgi:hypothetical protein